MGRWLDPAAIERLAADPAQRMRVPEIASIDFTRPFVPESYTQLYYTPLYRGLHHEHRLRYNQLFAIRINEYIMMLEADLVERLLTPLRRHPNVASDATLVRCLDTMIEEEKHHYRCFLALNRLCRPDLFRTRERFFSHLPWPTRALFGAVGLVSGRLSFALWYLMAMEESSATLARDMAREPVTETLGPLEPGFAAVHREHMRDETRHLQIDGILADLCLSKAGDRTRALNARLFKSVLDTITRPTRAGSGVKVIRQLVREMPELSWHEQQMIDAVLGLKRDKAFQTSLFNRNAMPLTFGVFDRTNELNDLGAAMTGYDRH
ncbi:MAG TPA: diiron oxygenase [Vicinamibacterales bacterium]|nr:diiron oxygenase [Vicinamibacterales bacterium]